MSDGRMILAAVARIDMIVSACWRWAVSAVIVVLAVCAIVMVICSGGEDDAIL